MSKETITVVLDGELVAELRQLRDPQTLFATVEAVLKDRVQHLRHLVAVDEWLAEMETEDGPVSPGERAWAEAVFDRRDVKVDFTPLLSEQLDQVGSEIGVDLTSVGRSEVVTTGGRRIDIVAEDASGSEFVIENQYGRADHDHLTRGLAYAVARRAHGLVVVAEEHRDQFRAVAEYLNELAEQASDGGIYVWLCRSQGGAHRQQSVGPSVLGGGGPERLHCHG